MLGFWETKMRDKQLLVYSYVPLFGLTDLLLRAASCLWHSWSKRRREELKTLASGLKQSTEQMRGNGIAWGYATLQNERGLGINIPLIERNIGTIDSEKDPDAVPYLVAGALKLLFTMYPALEEIRRNESDYNHLFKKVRNVIETLMEAPYLGEHPEISKESLTPLGKCALFLECQNLCFFQATLEDHFYRGRKEKRKNTFSEKEIKGLCAQLGVPYDDFWKGWSGEYSPWWAVSESFKSAFEREKAAFVSSLGCGQLQKDSILKAFQFGTPYSNFSPDCCREECIPRSEAVIKALIALFMSQMGGKSFDPGRLLPEAK